MNKRLATLTLAVSLFASTASALDGAWTGTTLERKPDHVNLNLVRGRSNMIGTTFRVSEFSGLTAAQVQATAPTPVNFELRREAGNVSFEGSFRNGKGAGHYTFAANRGYFAAVRALGVDTEERERRGRREKSDEERLFVYALHDLSTAFIRSMQAEGFSVSLEKYLELRIFDVTPEYIREMRSLGFRDLSAKHLVGARIHGVTPDYIRRTRAAGWNLSMKQLQEAAIHGVTPQFADELAQSGYANLPFKQLIAFRIHGVTPQFIADLRALGYSDIPAKKLIDMRIFNVSPRFIRELRDAGYKNVPVEKMIRMRISGLEPETLKKLDD